MSDVQKYHCVSSAEEAQNSALHEQGAFCYVAGGTDLFVHRQHGINQVPCLIDITNVRECKGIAWEAGHIRIGALTTLQDLEDDSGLSDFFPPLRKAVRSIASPLIRKYATAGGNLLCENRCIFYNQSSFWRTAAGHCLKDGGEICIATGGKKACFSKFSSDLAPVLMTLNAEVELLREGRRLCMPLINLYTGNGVRHHTLADSDLLLNIRIPENKPVKGAFHKLRQRESLEFTSLSVAVARLEDGTIRIAVGGMDPRPVLIQTHSNEGPEAAIKKALKQTRTVNNDLFSRGYRKAMMRVYIEWCWKELSR